MNADDRIIFGSSNVFRLYVPGVSTTTATDERKDSSNEEISWHYAMEELNEAQMAAFGEQHRAEREQAEKLRQLMEQKLKDMEEQIKLERASGGARAAELEEKLNQERSRADRMQKRKEKEAEMRSLMDQKLLKTIGLVEEANIIANELSKGMNFSIKLRVNQSQAVREATEDDFMPALTRSENLENLVLSAKIIQGNITTAIGIVSSSGSHTPYNLYTV